MTVTNESTLQWAGNIVAFAKATFEVDLDYSVESLTNVERMLTELSKLKDLEHRDAAIVGFGCYVGEVLVRHGNGNWVDGEKHDEMMGTPWLVQLPKGVTANPIGRCHKFMANGKKDGVSVWATVTLAMSQDSFAQQARANE